MSYFFKFLSGQTDKPKGLTLVVGAGNGQGLPLLRQMGSRRLVMVEAHPRQAEALTQLARPENNEEVWPLAISNDESASLHVLNDLKCSSLKPPHAIIEYSPNLRVIEQMDVPVRTLGDAIRGLTLEEYEQNTLVLAAPGQGVEILKSLDVELEGFSWVILHGAAVPLLYAGDVVIDSVFEWMSDRGFDLIDQDPDVPYPQAAALFARNDERIQLVRLTRRVAALAADKAALETEKTALVKTQVEREKQLLAESSQLTGERDKLRTERDQLSADCATQRKLATERQSQLDALQKQLTEKQQLHTQLEADLNEATMRQQLMNQELIKAEAQIDLIKDLLLREPGL